MINEEKVMEDIQEVKKNTGLEKHIQTILLSLITACLIGAYIKASDISDRLIKMEVREETKKEQLDNLELKVNKVQMDLLDLKDRLIRVESSQIKTPK